MRRFLILLSLCCAASLAVSQEGIITTVVGADQTKLPVNIPATIAPLGNVTALAIGPDNSVYGLYNFQIFKISPTGVFTVVAGTGVAGSPNGDGGPALQAKLSPSSFGAMALDAAGNIYLTEAYRVRKIDTNGVITTFAGTGQQGSFGTGGGDGGPATAATFVQLAGIACDSVGNVYVADINGERVRQITTDGIIHTFAGNGTIDETDGVPATSTGMPLPYYLAFDASDNLFIAQYNQSTIYKVTSIGIIVRVATNVLSPSGLAVRAGTIYFSTNNMVQQIVGGVTSTFAGTGTNGYQGDGGAATSARLYEAGALAIDAAGNVYISDTLNSRIRRVDSSGVIHTFAGAGSMTTFGDGFPALSVFLNNPQSVALDPAGNLIIADTGNHRIAKVDSNGTFTVIAGTGIKGAGTVPGTATSVALNNPTGVAVDANFIYISDSTNNRILKLNHSGTLSLMASASTTGPIAIDQNGTVYCVDSVDGYVSKVTSLGSQPFIYAGLGSLLTGVGIDSSGIVYFSNGYTGLVERADVKSGAIVPYAGGGVSTADGVLATTAALSPGPLSFDPLGNLYIADLARDTIRRVSPTGLISTVAGVGTYGFSGDGGRADAAALNLPLGTYADGQNNLYIADARNNRIRKVSGVVTHGAVVPGSASAAAGGVARIPLNLSLTDVSQINGLNFTVTVTPTNSAPALTGTLGFQQDTPSIAPSISATSSTISISWTGLAVPLVDFNHLGDVLLPIPASARSGSVYHVVVTADTANSASTTLSLALLSSSDVSVALDYLVGDSYPGTASAAPSFGDGTLNNLDLIQLLRAVTGVPGYGPAPCTDRFDAMDAYPADTASTRGGDGVLDGLDLLALLRRVSGVDTSAPRRVARDLYCPADISRTPATNEGRIEVGALEAIHPRSNSYRTPLYINLSEPQSLLTLSFSVEIPNGHGPLQFLPAAAPLPTLADSALPGTLSLAWLEGLSLPAGRVLIGYVQFTRSMQDSPPMHVHGVSARSRDRARALRIGGAQ